MNKIIIAIIVVVVVALGGYFLLKGPSYKAPSANLPAPTVPQGTSQTSPAQTETPALQGTPVTGQNVVSYTNSGYSPSTLRVKVGDTVTFKNSSSQSMWTASAFHPTHTAYPTTGGCIGSTFDACKGIQPSASWSFKFDIVGSWKYHNHLNPSNTGTIIVE